ncbi:MAG: ribosome-associated translation inhibitor RaiA [Bacteroidia bacterium]|nr:ribosome-associated translation inhibitor RaiA [Bacteroidia bacterium]MDW8158535.1 ribosome-associated translation inhibitor RaiA [Bacteroidia bacterium]
MRVTIQSTNAEVSPTLKEFINNKLAKLEQFYDSIIDVQVYLKVDKNNSAGNNVVEIKVLVPSNTLIANEQGKTFEEATDLCIENIKRQVKKFKEKKQFS